MMVRFGILIALLNRGGYLMGHKKKGGNEYA
jgi:hypothetical protein